MRHILLIMLVIVVSGCGDGNSKPKKASKSGDSEAIAENEITERYKESLCECAELEIVYGGISTQCDELLGSLKNEYSKLSDSDKELLDEIYQTCVDAALSEKRNYDFETNSDLGFFNSENKNEFVTKCKAHMKKMLEEEPDSDIPAMTLENLKSYCDCAGKTLEQKQVDFNTVGHFDPDELYQLLINCNRAMADLME